MIVPNWILYGWFALAALSTAYVAWDNFARKNPEETVMKWGFLKDTVNVGPGERYDVIWTARRARKWLLHCHIPHHTTNENVEEEGGGGLTPSSRSAQNHEFDVAYESGLVTPATRPKASSAS